MTTKPGSRIRPVAWAVLEDGRLIRDGANWVGVFRSRAEARQWRHNNQGRGTVSPLFAFTSAWRVNG